MLKKGYNIVCKSWENDVDYYNTKVVVVKTENEARFYSEWLKLFEFRHDNLQISNLYESKGNEEYLISETKRLCKDYGVKLYEGITDDQWNSMEKEQVIDVCIERASEFAGSSEHYGFRVVSNIEVYYLEKDLVSLSF